MIVLALGGALVLYFVWLLCSRPTDFPPGPRGWPLVGCLFSISKWHPDLIHLGLTHLSRRHGEVVGFFIGLQPVISISGYDACREVFLTKSLDGRPDNAIARMKSKGLRRGIMLVDGEFWSEQRRFLSRHLSYHTAESIAHREIAALVHLLTELGKAGPVHFKNTFNVFVINVLWSLIAGSRFHQHDDPRLKHLVELVDYVSRSGDIVRAAFPCPPLLLAMFPSIFEKLGRMDLLGKVRTFIEEAIDEHKKTFAVEPRDFIDCYLREVGSGQRDDSFSEDQLQNVILDVFSSGADTTSHSIGFALLHVLHRPDVQDALQEELDRVCGHALPTLADKPRLVYTQAVLMEVNRMSSIAPLAIPRRALTSTSFRGYVIPKDAYVIVNLHSIHMDRRYWKDPEVFRPERHIDGDGQLIHNDRLTFFGGGRRSCLGEPLAKLTQFLFTAAMVKTFRFDQVPGLSPPCLQPLDGFTLAHRPFYARLSPRKP